MKLRRRLSFVRAAILGEKGPRTRLLESAPRGGVAAEVGVWKGDFSVRVLEYLRPREAFFIDPWEFVADSERWWGGRIARSQADMDAVADAATRRIEQVGKKTGTRVHIVRSKSLDVELSNIDWLYLDGDHSYETVASELKRFWPMLSPQGTVAGDDFLNVYQGSQPVMKAVTEFAIENNIRLHLMGNQFVLRKTEVGSFDG